MNGAVNPYLLNSPVAFFIFNRPNATERVFAEIAKARPAKLLVVADGPRENYPGDDKNCAASRFVIDKVDWDCEVLRCYSETNLGCKRRVSSGLDWVFDTVERAIILEDDCLPHATFFRFCDELLDKYANDSRIGLISGDNFLSGKRRTDHSYYFSHNPHIWGWASWRRTWQQYDVTMKSWPLIRDAGWLNDLVDSKMLKRYWKRLFQSVYDGSIDTWDYQLVFCCWTQSLLAIMPNVNLVSNIGFGPDATFTKTLSPMANGPTQAVLFPLCHPPFVMVDKQADVETQRQFIKKRHLLKGAIRRVYHLWIRFGFLRRHGFLDP
jgi:hypothetical protein